MTKRELNKKIKTLSFIGNTKFLKEILYFFSENIEANNTNLPNNDALNNVKYVTFNNSVSFKNFPLVMQQKQINEPTTISVNTTGAIAGASILMRLVADGNIANTPLISGAEQITGSSGWDNRAGIVNLIQFQFDGTDYYYSIFQKANGVVLDLQAPVLVSSVFDSSLGKFILTFNENLSTTSLPLASKFIGLSVSKVSVLGKTIILTTLALPNTATVNLQYSGTDIKDLAGNSAIPFQTNITISVAPNPVNLASRVSGINEISVGTYVATTGNSWKPAIATSKNFVGDQTFEMTASSGTSGQGIIGLDATAVDAVTLGDWPNLDLGMAWYGGNYQAMQQGQGQVPCGGYIAGDLVRLDRVAGVIKAQRKRGATDWVDLYAFPTANNTPFATVLYLNDATSQCSLVIY